MKVISSHPPPFECEMTEHLLFLFLFVTFFICRNVKWCVYCAHVWLRSGMRAAIQFACSPLGLSSLDITSACYTHLSKIYEDTKVELVKLVCIWPVFKLVTATGTRCLCTFYLPWFTVQPVKTLLSLCLCRLYSSKCHVFIVCGLFLVSDWVLQESL